MIKRLLALILIIGIAVISPVSAIMAVSDITDAVYVGSIRVSNSSYTATEVCVPFTLNTQAMIDGYYLDSDCSNSALLDSAGADMKYMPAVGTGDDWIIFIDQLSQKSSKYYNLYTGGASDMGGDIRYFPDNAGMTSSDAASLELGNNFIIEQSGYLEMSAGTDKNLVHKGDAFKLCISDDEELTAIIYGSTGVEYLLPNAAGTYSNLSCSTANSILYPDGTVSTAIASCYPGSGEAHWQDVDEASADEGAPDV